MRRGHAWVGFAVRGAGLVDAELQDLRSSKVSVQVNKRVCLHTRRISVDAELQDLWNLAEGVGVHMKDEGICASPREGFACVKRALRLMRICGIGQKELALRLSSHVQ